MVYCVSHNPSSSSLDEWRINFKSTTANTTAFNSTSRCNVIKRQKTFNMHRVPQWHLLFVLAGKNHFHLGHEVNTAAKWQTWCFSLKAATRKYDKRQKMRWLSVMWAGPKTNKQTNKKIDLKTILLGNNFIDPLGETDPLHLTHPIHS